MNDNARLRRFEWLSRLVLVVAAILLLPMSPGSPARRTAQAEGPAKDQHPRIVKTVPEIGATDVDVDLKEIRVKFDRDMQSGMSWTGGEPLFPPGDKKRKARWVDQRTCVLPVQLESGTYYRVGINSAKFQNFKSNKGVAAPASAIYFVTVGAETEVADRVRVPKIVQLEPAHGDKTVDPATKQISVTFDVPMGDGMSWTGGGEEFPKLVEGRKASWSADKQTCTLPVELKAGQPYRLGVNSLSHINFQSEWGVPVAPVEYAFRTR